jgi:hypothetical protein
MVHAEREDEKDPNLEWFVTLDGSDFDDPNADPEEVIE